MITSRSLGPTAKGRTMQTIENGSERMRNTTAAPFPNTKNLRDQNKRMVFASNQCNYL